MGGGEQIDPSPLFGSRLNGKSCWLRVICDTRIALEHGKLV